MAVRSHKVHTEDGRVYRRNRSHRYKVPEKYQPISDFKAIKSERTSRNPIPSYVVQRTRSVSRYFSYIFMCSFSMVKFSKKLTYSLYFVSSKEIAFCSVVKNNKNNFLRALFFPPQKRNKQINKDKKKKKTKKHSSSLLILN